MRTITSDLLFWMSFDTVVKGVSVHRIGVGGVSVTGPYGLVVLSFIMCLGRFITPRWGMETYVSVGSCGHNAAAVS